MSDSSPEVAPGRRVWLPLWVGLLLAAYLAWLGWSAWSGRSAIEWPVLKLADLPDNGRLLDWVSRAVRTALTAAGRLLPVGLLLPFVIGRGGTWWTGFIKWLAAVLLTVGVAALVFRLEIGSSPTAAQLLLPVLGGTLGVLIGTTLLGGWRSVVRSAFATVLLLLVLAGGGIWLLDECLDREPPEFEPPQVTSVGKRRVVNRVRYAPHKFEDGVEMRHVRMTGDDLNFLLAWWHSMSRTDGRTRVRIVDDKLETEASFPLNLPRLGERHLNLRTAGRVEVDEHRRSVAVEQLEIANLSLPSWLLESLSFQLDEFFPGDSDIGNALAAIRRVELEPGAVGVVFEEREFKSRVLPALKVEMGAAPELVTAVRAQVRHLIEVAPTLPAGDARFGAFVQAAFSLARQRTELSEPVLENRAAVFALAILLGHRRIEWLTGPVWDDELRRAARRHVGEVTIRGRVDWTRHFLVSAALAVWSSESLSNAMGLLKEELDAARGGSGFSFADLLADRAGTRLGRAAIRDEAAAWDMQQQLGGEFRIDDVFPAAADLPEELSDAELKSQFGGVGGAEYAKMIEEIERRLDRCRLLQ